MAYPPPPNSWTPEFKQSIVQKLQEKHVRFACPMCGTASFVLLDGFFNNAVSFSPGLFFGGPVVPTVALACSNCGFISQHAVGALGLLPNPQAEAHK